MGELGESALAAASLLSETSWPQFICAQRVSSLQPDVHHLPHLVAPFLLAKAFGAVMVNAGSGAVVNVASVAGMQGVADRSAYNASKHGLIGLTRTLAVEWGAKGVRVNAVCPGWVKTEMDHKDQAGGSYSDEDITEHVPMGRFARPDDIAQAIAWLCDASKSGFVNGISLPVDGGWTADGSWQSLRLRHRDAQ